MSIELRDALGLPKVESPFPWQSALLNLFLRGVVPPALDIPTGLGKTAVMAIWLVARAKGAQLPRRLVYVVDRRAVVDQATTEALRLRAWVDENDELRRSLGLARHLPISTLRGQFVDNREWLEDPSVPAIIVGTVDMIGSRVLFEGYGVSRKMRPYHAGLLGNDALIVLDEAHLVPPFERLLGSIARGGSSFGPREAALRDCLPRFELLSLSATGRQVDGALGLTPADLEHAIVLKRLEAAKRLRILTPDGELELAESLATEAWRLVGDAKTPVRCIVFCNSRKDAIDALRAIEDRSKGDKKAVGPSVDFITELFVGGRRVFEREEAAKRLAQLGFIAGSSQPPPVPTFLFATSAAEVGVDLDADHMVSDLVAWERMVQRLGRVNRRGNGEAQVSVVLRPPTKLEQKVLETPEDERSPRDMHELEQYMLMRASLRALEALPAKAGAIDVSPGALQRARRNPKLAELLRAATTPEPLRPGLSRPLIDAWSMTALREHTARPDVQPWLRGWIEERPQTSVIWRRFLPIRADGSIGSRNDVEEFFEAAPPQTVEMLEAETYQVVEWLLARAAATAKQPRTQNGADDGQESDPCLTDVVAIVLTGAGELREHWYLFELLDHDAFEDAARKASRQELTLVDRLRNRRGTGRREKIQDAVHSGCAGATLVVDRRLGGLESRGLLDEDIADLASTIDDKARSLCRDGDGVPSVRFRVWSTDAPPPEGGPWRRRYQFKVREAEEGDGAYLVVDKWLHDAETEEDRSSAARSQLLEEHEEWAEADARVIGEKVLPPEYREVLSVAARLHDEGKRASRWQRAFNAPPGGTYAKTRGPINFSLLDRYRHELGSLPYAKASERLAKLSEDQRDLVLHLIAAHHGFARPLISTTGCDDGPPSAIALRAREVALRFVRLQRQWGPWGLAWWEALLRAADQQASRRNDELEDA